MKHIILTAALVLFAASGIAQAPATVSKTQPPKPMEYDVLIQTSLGDIKVVLFDDAPQHKAQFLKLASEGFYDSTYFHRVIKDFMIQGGDPNTKDPAKAGMAGMGGNDHPLPAEISNKHFHLRGMLCAARQGDQINPQRKSGTQFYIVQGGRMDSAQLASVEMQLSRSIQGFKYPDEVKKAYLEQGGAPWLDMQYTIFGQVVEGMEVVDKIAAQPMRDPRAGVPATPVTITVKVNKKD